MVIFAYSLCITFNLTIRYQTCTYVKNYLHAIHFLFKNRLFVFLNTENVRENVFGILSSIIHEDVVSTFFIFNYKLEEHMQ